MTTEAKAAADTSSANAAAVGEKVAAEAAAAKTAQSTASKVASAPKPKPAPKAPNGPKKVSLNWILEEQSGKGKKIVVGSLVVLLGAGGLYRYHTNNDHLACINGAKGGNGSDLLKTLYLVPKDLESKVCLFAFF